MILTDPYLEENFLDYLKDFLPDFLEDSQSIDVGKSGFTEIKMLGESPELRTKVLAIKGKFNLDSRLALTKKSFQVLKKLSIFRCLIVYLNEEEKMWRLSLLTAVPRIIKGSVLVQYSNPKRHSYVLGTELGTRTARKYLSKLGRVKDFEDLVFRFSVEAVNKDFYAEVNSAFYELVGKYDDGGVAIEPPILSLPNPNYLVDLQNYSVRLLGRILFIWFLKQKQSVGGKPLLPKELVEDLTSVNILRECLEPLFFEVLNKPIGERRPENAKNGYEQVPYLNGGLFQPISGPSGDFYHWNNDEEKVIVPDAWFLKLFETLNTYNFTIDENLDNDVDLSIDPEMLGRVFENLLAEINPVTGEVARKSTGSYYTPRSIVSYMVDESLEQFLVSNTNVAVEKIRALITTDTVDDQEHPLSPDEKTQLVSSLRDLKFFDPACGSGAFPIGMLQKLLWIIEQVDPFGEIFLKESKTKRTSSDQNRPTALYRIKKHIIRNSIFGADIQPIALEISRLRCFLTLIVDQSVLDDQANRGIDPLPNLDFKFVCANSLIPLSPKQHTVFGEDPDLDEKLLRLREKYFDNTDHSKRKKLQELYLQLIRGSESLFVESTRTAQLKSYHPFQSENAAEFFDSSQMFGQASFDIVLANPPYIDSRGMVRSGQAGTREFISKNYRFAKGSWDIYIAFFERGLSLLNDSGTLVFITPDKWLSKPFGQALRTHELKRIKSILVAGRQVFDSAKIDSVISTFTSKEHPNLEILEFVDGVPTKQQSIPKTSFEPPYALDSAFSPHFDFLRDSASNLGKLGELCVFESACATDDAYKLKPLVQNLSGEYDPRKYFKVINTGTILPFGDKWGKSEMVYLGGKYLFPVVKREEFLEKFPNTYSQKAQKSKLIVKGLNLLDATLDLEGSVIPGIPTIIGSSENHDDLYFALGILNSRFALFYIKNRYPASSYNQGITFTKDMLSELPIPSGVEKDKKAEFVELVKSIYARASTEGFDLIEAKQSVEEMLVSMYHFTEKERSLFA
jgi:hypothetical protein